MKNILLALILSLFINQSCTNSEAAIPVSNVQTTQSLKLPESVVITPIEERLYNPKILPHLIKIVEILETGVDSYDWANNTSCNMGLLAQSITNASASDIKYELSRYNTQLFNAYCKKQNNGQEDGSWTTLTNFYCGVTNKPISGIVGKLQKAGFTSLDISHIEYCSDPYILSNIHKDIKYNNKEDYILYMKTWRDIVKEQVK